MSMPYIYRWDRQGRKGQFCRVLARGKMNSCLVEFEDGYQMVTSRHIDEMRGTVTYDLGNGRYATFDTRIVREVGLATLLQDYDIEMPTERLPVIHHGRRVGTMAPDFDPVTARSISFMYDVRPGDFRREGDTWVAGRTLGPGDLECVAGFVWDSRAPDQ
jgi:hypothetical protein